MTIEADVEHPGGTVTVSGFTRIETTTLGHVRVYYDADDPRAGFNPQTLLGPTDEGLFYEEYSKGSVEAVRVEDDSDRDPQLIV